MNNSIISKLQALNCEVEFINGREKGDTIKDGVFTVNQYDYMLGQNDDGTESEYVVFTVSEDETYFYFGGSVMTKKFKEIDTILTETEKAELIKEGIRVQFEEKTSKNKRKYIKITLFPNV